MSSPSAIHLSSTLLSLVAFTAGCFIAVCFPLDFVEAVASPYAPVHHSHDSIVRAVETYLSSKGKPNLPNLPVWRGLDAETVIEAQPAFISFNLTSAVKYRGRCLQMAFADEMISQALQDDPNPGALEKHWSTRKRIATAMAYRTLERNSDGYVLAKVARQCTQTMYPGKNPIIWLVKGNIWTLKIATDLTDAQNPYLVNTLRQYELAKVFYDLGINPYEAILIGTFIYTWDGSNRCNTDNLSNTYDSRFDCIHVNKQLESTIRFDMIQADIKTNCIVPNTNHPDGVCYKILNGWKPSSEVITSSQYGWDFSKPLVLASTSRRLLLTLATSCGTVKVSCVTYTIYGTKCTLTITPYVTTIKPIVYTSTLLTSVQQFYDNPDFYLMLAGAMRRRLTGSGGAEEETEKPNQSIADADLPVNDRQMGVDSESYIMVTEEDILEELLASEEQKDNGRKAEERETSDTSEQNYPNAHDGL